MTKKQKIIAIVLELTIAICGFLAVILSLTTSGDFMSGSSTILYFTIQSNIWISLVLLACAVILTIEIIKEKEIFPKWLYNVKLVFTVSITLTGIVFCTMLAPFMGKEAWTLINVLAHVVVPIGSIVDFILFSSKGKYTYKQAFFVIIPPIYYLCFSLVGYLLKWNFGGGKNYPYPFLNYGGSAGVFGFSTDTSDSLFFGSFYWIVLLVGFVIGVGMLYTKIIHVRQKKVEEKSE